jgi:hypothetical protein
MMFYGLFLQRSAYASKKNTEMESCCVDRD